MANSLTYPLLPFSQLVYEMTRWMPRELYTNSMTFRVKGGADRRKQWHEALERALTNHPVFSTRIDCHMLQYAVQPPNILEGKYHHIALQTQGEDLIIKGRVNRVLGDGTSLAILIDDIRRAYCGESMQPDDYWGYLEYVEQLKQSDHYLSSREWLISEFADESIPVHPTLDRPLWTLLPPKVGLLHADYTKLHQGIYHLGKEYSLSFEGIFSLCVALAIAEYCDTDAAALTWAYVGRERPEEQRIFGSLHRDIPFNISIQHSVISSQREDLIRQACNQTRSGIAHSDYPYTLTAPYSKRWNYAVNVLRVEDEYELIKFLPQPVELLPSPPQKYAYALLDVEIHESAERLDIVYRYSATHYRSESIQRFAALVHKYVEWLLEE